MPVLTALSREINETIHFTRRYDACRATLLDEILPQQGLIAASSPTRSLLLLHLCCTGLAILSTQTDEDIRDYCDAVVFEKRSCPFILSSSQLMEKIAAVRREGYMLNDQMYEPGVAALGVPIFAQPGEKRRVCHQYLRPGGTHPPAEGEDRGASAKCRTGAERLSGLTKNAGPPRAARNSRRELPSGCLYAVGISLFRPRRLHRRKRLPRRRRFQSR